MAWDEQLDLAKSLILDFTHVKSQSLDGFLKSAGIGARAQINTPNAAQALENTDESRRRWHDELDGPAVQVSFLTQAPEPRDSATAHA